ncbi:MAG: aminopeptidase [Phenylobacterium sp.]|nr:aminopeptidase [Phenylobacterium sp.]
MRILTLLAASAIALTAFPAMAQDLTAKAAALADKALDDPTGWDLVESLTTEIGPRPVGSPALARARDWGVARLKALGFANVHVEPFTTGAWSRGAESAEVVGPWPQKLAILGLGGSSPTPPGGLTAPIVVFSTYRAMLDQPPGALAGKIAVVTEKMTRTQDGSGYGGINANRTEGPVEAARRGAIAYLVRSLSTDDTRLPHTGTANPGRIPAAALSTVDAELLDHMAGRGRTVTVKLDMVSTFNPSAQAWNVVGEIPGRETPDEVIVVGGHLDSWDPGTGAVDDGAGVAIMTAAAKLAGAERPRRTIRVVMFGSEEQGGSGDAYAAAHKAEVGRMVVAGESDLGADRIWSLRLPKNSAAHPAMKAFLAAIGPLRVIHGRGVPQFGGSDIEGLITGGAPFVDFNQDASRYFDLHHSADDTLDKIKPEDLAQNVAVWAAFIYTVANSDIDFRKLAAGGQ